jgi:type II secretory pathway component GspD/PulD (secretin)
MQRNHSVTQRSKSVWISPLLFLSAFLLLVLPVGAAAAQTQASGPACPDAKNGPETYQTFYLSHSMKSEDASELVADLRNNLQGARVVYVGAQHAVSVCGSTAYLELAHKIISDLDQPRKTWRLTYTITQTGGAQPTSPQHVSFIVAAGERADLKQGTRVPIVIGATAPDASSTSTQVQYVDVGLNISADVNGSADSVQIHTKVEQSQVSDEKSGSGAQDPVIHQTTLDVTSNLIPGKPMVLGTLDIPGDTRHEQIEVTAEPIS